MVLDTRGVQVDLGRRQGRRNRKLTRSKQRLVRDLQWVALYREQCSMAEIAELYGVDRSTVWRRIKACLAFAEATRAG